MDEELSSSVEDNIKLEHHHKWLNEGKFLIRVDPLKYQAFVPDTPQCDELKNLKIRPKCKLAYAGNQINRGVQIQDKDEFNRKLEDYLLFAQSLMTTDGKPSGVELQLQQTDFNRGTTKRTIYTGDGLILSGAITSTQQIHEKALDFLQKVEFNFTKAKFYLLFPTMMIFNKFAPQNQISLTDEQMKLSIENYISILNEDKLGLELKWKQELADMITKKPKVHLIQLQHYIDQGQHLKYEVPDNLRTIVIQAQTVSKTLSKLIRNQEKQKINQLAQTLENSEESISVLTTEIIQLKEIVIKVNIWVQRIKTFQIPWQNDDDYKSSTADVVFESLLKCPEQKDKISFKFLKNQVLEYKSLPILSLWFENIHKRLYDYVKDLVEKLGKTVNKVTQSKTRSAQLSVVVTQDKGDKMTLNQANELANQINSVAVSCEEYECFMDQYQESKEVHERCCMYLQDGRRDNIGFFKDIQGLLKEVLECSFQLDVQDKLQDLSDYISAFEKIKKTINQNKMGEAYKEIQEAKERGFCSGDLLKLESILLKILEWNQKSEKLLNPQDTLEMIDIYLNKMSINQNNIPVEFSDLLPVNKEIVDFIDKQKVLELEELQQKSNQWACQLKQFLEPRVNTRKDVQKPKNLTILWDLIKEGLQFYRNEKSLLQKGIVIFTSILDWTAQIFSLQQNYKSFSNTYMQIEGQDSLIDIIGSNCLWKIIHEKHESPKISHTLDSLYKLLKSATPYVVGTYELDCLENLIGISEKWNKEAENLILQQTPFSVTIPSSVIQYDSNICKLLSEQKTLPINTQLVTQLNGIYEANKKATYILSIINNREQILEPLLIKIQEDDKLLELQKNLQNLLLNQASFTPSKMKKSNSLSVSFVAKQFFQNHLTTIMKYLNEIIKLDSTKFKKITSTHTKLNKLKEISSEFSIHCQNCPTILIEGFQSVKHQLINTITNYENWQNRIQKLLTSDDNNQSQKKKKRSVKIRNNATNDSLLVGSTSLPQIQSFNQLPQIMNQIGEDSGESQIQESSEIQQTKPHLSGEMLYYFKVPDILTLFLEAIQFSYFCSETFDAWKFLENLTLQIQDTQDILQNEEHNKTPKDIYLNQMQIFMPQFHILGKLQEMTQHWIANASYIINQIPRAKNLFVQSKMKSFIDHINTVSPELLTDNNMLVAQMIEEQISSHQDNHPKKKEKRTFKEKQQINQDQDHQRQAINDKPKREKKISSLMQDKNMAFYDPNASLKKAFGGGDKQIKIDLSAEKPSAQKNKKNKKLWQKQKSSKNESRRGSILSNKSRKYTQLEQVNQYQDLNINNQQFLQSFKDCSQELQSLYIYDNPYCICRQGGECQITDWNILKCMGDQKVSEFFILHLKQQESKKIMVQCDTCNEWFHQECIGIKTHQMKQSDKYSCRVCVMKQHPIFLIGTKANIDQIISQKATKEYSDVYNLQQIYLKQSNQLEEYLSSAGDIFYNRYQKTTLKNFEEFINLGKNIPLYLIELDALQLIHEKILKWLDKTKHIIQFAPLISLFSESLWFPVHLDESDKLLQMIQQIEFVKKAQEVQQGKRSFLGKGKVIKKALVDRTLLLHDYLAREEIDQNELFLIKLLETLRVQQDLNSSLDRQILQLTHRNGKLDEYQELWERFDQLIKFHQKTQSFEVTKHIDLGEKIAKAKGLEIKLINYFQDELRNQQQNHQRQFGTYNNHQQMNE